MKKWKIALITILTAFSLVACGAQDGNANDAVSQETSVESQESRVADTVTESTAEESKESEEVETAVEFEGSEYSLKEVLAEYDMKAGTCLSSFMINNKLCSEIIKHNFNSITFENDLKPDYVFDQKASQTKGDLVVKFNDNTLKLLEWCKENDMAVRGHTLIWHSQTPSWIFYDNFKTSGKLVDREVMLARMESYISQIFAQLDELGYAEMIYAYDVVNEAWMEDGSKRESLWLTTIGDDYLWQAFYLADKYAPEHMDLYYNDYNEQFKTDTLYDFVQTLKDEEGNYLIDGIGFQAHLYTEDSLVDYFATMDKLATLGLKINLTELDVCLGTWPDIKPATEENLKIQGQFYYDLVNGILERVKAGSVKMDALTFWGFTDGLSWRKERNPMLYDKFYKPKYAYYGAVQVKEQAGFEDTEATEE